MTTQMFGAPVQRKEDPRLLTGNGRYLDDLEKNGFFDKLWGSKS